MPKMEVKSNAKPSTFAYPPNLEEKKDAKKDKVETAILSITAKHKKKEAEKKKDEEKMEVVSVTKSEKWIRKNLRVKLVLWYAATYFCTGFIVNCFVVFFSKKKLKYCDHCCVCVLGSMAALCLQKLLS